MIKNGGVSIKYDFYKGSNFWKENGWMIREPIDVETVNQAEKILNVQFPISYIELLKQQNGGEPNYPNFFISTGHKKDITDIEGIILDPDDGSSFLYTKGVLKEVGLPQELFVLWNDYHNWLVLDYRKTKKNPPVFYIMEDYSAEEKSWDYFEVAPSFDNFLKKLFRVPPLDPKNLKPSYSRKK
ncbi:SMI1/KNR4 family protein [Anaerobacillus sp. MEB173]|uniref:SMI1/KNR4 family protein n=1 Tax=Anaerobacillus sp. MEB173 TaxID=3383345 RepID=UPI003F932E3A